MEENTRSSDGENKKYIQNFGKEIRKEASTWKYVTKTGA